MKAPYGFTSQSKKAMIREINRQIVSQEDKFIQKIDAMILWTLRVELGFGKKRLERFYKAVIRNYKELCKFYEMEDTYPAEYKLREIGVDLDKLRKENT
jgi:hypothetical protein